MRPSLIVPAVLVLSSFAAQADTLTVSTTTGAFSSTYMDVTKQLPIQGFNPALGTLDSITATVSGSYTTQSFNTPDHESNFIVYLTTRQYSAPANGKFVSGNQREFQLGTFNFSATGTVTDPALLAFFTSNGNVAPTIDLVDSVGNPTVNGTPNGLAIQLTYNYTAPAPEPASFALLGTGLLGLASAVRRRLQ